MLRFAIVQRFESSVKPNEIALFVKNFSKNIGIAEIYFSIPIFLITIII